MIDYTALAFAILAVAFWTKGAQIENRSPVIWVALSVAISVIVIVLLHRSWLAILIGQLLLMVVITVYRTLTEKSPGKNL